MGNIFQDYREEQDITSQEIADELEIKNAWDVRDCINHPDKMDNEMFHKLVYILNIPLEEAAKCREEYNCKHKNIFMSAKNNSNYSYTDMARELNSSPQRMSNNLNKPQVMGKNMMLKIARLLRMDIEEATKYWLKAKAQEKYGIVL